MDYELTDFTRVPELAAQAVRLTNNAFAEYDETPVNERWMEWYLDRPGFDLSLCQAALAGDTMVSQVIAVEQPVQLGDALLPCVIVENVATDPAHRQHGLARKLMERAHEEMRVRRIEAAILYTDPRYHPYEFYQRLGYFERARSTMLIGPRPDATEEGPAPVDADERVGPLIELINRYHAGHEGFTPLGEELWRAYRIDAPMRPVVVAEFANSDAIATATFTRTELRVDETDRMVSVAWDLAADDMSPERMRSLLSAAEHDYVAVEFDDVAPERHAAGELGLRPHWVAVAMVLPLGSDARRALDVRRGPWYLMAEPHLGA